MKSEITIACVILLVISSSTLILLHFEKQEYQKIKRARHTDFYYKDRKAESMDNMSQFYSAIAILIERLILIGCLAGFLWLIWLMLQSF